MITWKGDQEVGLNKTYYYLYYYDNTHNTCSFELWLWFWSKTRRRAWMGHHYLLVALWDAGLPWDNTAWNCDFDFEANPGGGSRVKNCTTYLSLYRTKIYPEVVLSGIVACAWGEIQEVGLKQSSLGDWQTNCAITNICLMYSPTSCVTSGC